MAITIRQLAQDLRIVVTDDETIPAEQSAVLTRLMTWANAIVTERVVDTAPETLKDQAISQLVSYVYDSPQAGAGAAFANAWVNSGASSMLSQHVHRRAVILTPATAAPVAASGETPTVGGLTEAEVNRLIAEYTTGARVVELLAALAGDNRLPASAVRGLPGGGAGISAEQATALIATWARAAGATGTIPDAVIPSSIARDAEVTAMIAAAVRAFTVGDATELAKGIVLLARNSDVDATDGSEDGGRVVTVRTAKRLATRIVLTQDVITQDQLDDDSVGRPQIQDNAVGLTEINADVRARILPELPDAGQRDNKVPKFQGDTLGWEPDAQGSGSGSASASPTGDLKEYIDNADIRDRQEAADRVGSEIGIHNRNVRAHPDIRRAIQASARTLPAIPIYHWPVVSTFSMSTPGVSESGFVRQASTVSRDGSLDIRHIVRMERGSLKIWSIPQARPHGTTAEWQDQETGRVDLLKEAAQAIKVSDAAASGIAAIKWWRGRTTAVNFSTASPDFTCLFNLETAELTAQLPFTLEETAQQRYAIAYGTTNAGRAVIFDRNFPGPAGASPAPFGVERYRVWAPTADAANLRALVAAGLTNGETLHYHDSDNVDHLLSIASIITTGVATDARNSILRYFNVGIRATSAIPAPAFDSAVEIIRHGAATPTGGGGSVSAAVQVKSKATFNAPGGSTAEAIPQFTITVEDGSKILLLFDVSVSSNSFTGTPYVEFTIEHKLASDRTWTALARENIFLRSVPDAGVLQAILSDSGDRQVRVRYHAFTVSGVTTRISDAKLTVINFGGGGTTPSREAQTGPEIVALLSALTENARLPASAVRGIPSGTLTAAEIVRLLGSLTGDARLPATSIRDLLAHGGEIFSLSESQTYLLLSVLDAYVGQLSRRIELIGGLKPPLGVTHWPHVLLTGSSTTERRDITLSARKGDYDIFDVSAFVESTAFTQDQVRVRFVQNRDTKLTALWHKSFGKYGSLYPMPVDIPQGVYTVEVDAPAFDNNFVAPVGFTPRPRSTGRYRVYAPDGEGAALQQDIRDAAGSGRLHYTAKDGTPVYYQLTTSSTTVADAPSNSLLEFFDITLRPTVGAEILPGSNIEIIDEDSQRKPQLRRFRFVKSISWSSSTTVIGSQAFTIGGSSGLQTERNAIKRIAEVGAQYLTNISVQLYSGTGGGGDLIWQGALGSSTISGIPARYFTKAINGDAGFTLNSVSANAATDSLNHIVFTVQNKRWGNNQDIRSVIITLDYMDFPGDESD